MREIKWKAMMLDPKLIKPTRNNYKLKTDDGLARFRTSMKKYGLAGAIIVNTDYEIIDGNTRWEEALAKKEKKIIATVPDRKLTPKEFQEFSAMYDFARAGEVDMTRIKAELGTTKDFFKTWGLELPPDALSRLAELEKNDGKITPNKAKEKVQIEEISTSRITLLFTKEEAGDFVRLAESLYAKFKVDNITDLSLAALKFITKLKSK